MAKPKSTRAKRREFERRLANGAPKLNKQDFSDTIFTLKYRYSNSQIHSLFESTDRTKLLEWFPRELPTSYKAIRNNTLFRPINDLAFEVRWYSYIIRLFSDQINEFITASNYYYSLFLAGHYADAKEQLNQIENNICYSHWSIENKILLAEYESGFKKNKEVLTEMLDEGNSVFTNTLARYQSIRFEQNLSYFTYNELTKKYISIYSDDGISEYFRFRLDYYSDFDFQKLGYILSVENEASIIDKYTLFLIVVSHYLSKTEFDESIVDEIRSSLLRISSVIKDDRLVNLLYSIGETPSIHFDDKGKSYIIILDEYIKGNYNEVVLKTKSFLQNNSLYFELYEIYIKSCLFLNIDSEDVFLPDSIASVSFNHVKNIVHKNSDSQYSLIASHKLFNSLGYISFALKFYNFFKTEHSWIDESIDSVKLAQLNSSYINPILTLYLTDDYSSATFINYIETELGSLAIIDFFKAYKRFKLQNDALDLNNSVDQFNLCLLKSYTQIENKNFQDALLTLGDIEFKYPTKSSLIHNREKILKYKIDCYLSLQKLDSALEEITSYIIQNPEALNKFIYRDFLTEIKKTEDINLMSNISLPILLHQYQSYIAQNDIWISYDNFLNYNHLTYPKEIESIQSRFDGKKLIYFLKNICKQDVYDSSYLFENQDELDNERIDICSFLTLIDKDNYEEYVNEISDINRDQLVRKGIKQIDESKIYVDVKGIKKTLEKDLRESFSRSQNLMNLSLDQLNKLDESLENVVVPFYGKSVETNKIEFKERHIKLTSYSRFTQFADMFLKIRDKFIASNEFGIDTYLSMRIRHGTLLGEIRSVFENFHLVTKKDDTSNKYKDNKHWIDRFDFANNVLERNFNIITAEFSAEIDRISNDLKNKKLQVRTEKSDKKSLEGLFDYSYDDNSLLEMFTNRVGGIEEYEEFMETIITILWERTESNLAIIRTEISTTVKDELINLLNDLFKKLEDLLRKTEFPEANELFSNIIHCQTDMTNKLASISEWFNRTNSKTINEFDLLLPIDTTLKTVKRLFRDYSDLSPQVIVNCDVKFEGENFPHFTYIMQNLLHNIIQHSHLASNELNALISATLTDGRLVIIIQNDFSTSIELDRLNRAIDERQLSLQQAKLQDDEKIRSEDGTGYLKINKTIKTDLMRDNYSITIYNVDESRKFKTQIEFDIKNLQKVE